MAASECSGLQAITGLVELVAVAVEVTRLGSKEPNPVWRLVLETVDHLSKPDVGVGVTVLSEFLGMAPHVTVAIVDALIRHMYLERLSNKSVRCAAGVRPKERAYEVPLKTVEHVLLLERDRYPLRVHEGHLKQLQLLHSWETPDDALDWRDLQKAITEHQEVEWRGATGLSIDEIIFAGRWPFTAVSSESGLRLRLYDRKRDWEARIPADIPPGSRWLSSAETLLNHAGPELAEFGRRVPGTYELVADGAQWEQLSRNGGGRLTCFRFNGGDVLVEAVFSCRPGSPAAVERIILDETLRRLSTCDDEPIDDTAVAEATAAAWAEVADHFATPSPHKKWSRADLSEEAWESGAWHLAYRLYAMEDGL